MRINLNNLIHLNNYDVIVIKLNTKLKREVSNLTPLDVTLSVTETYFQLK